MMKYKRIKKLTAFLLSLSIFFQSSFSLWAMEPISDRQISANDLSEAMVLGEEISVSSNETIEEEFVTEDSVSNNFFEDDAKEAEVFWQESEKKEQFPGLLATYPMSEEKRQEKEVLEGYLPEILSLEEGIDYVSNEIIVAAANEEEAYVFAKAFGGKMKEFIQGKASFAVITLNSEDTKKEDMVLVEEAVLASVSEDLVLPPAWPNYYYQILEEETVSDTDVTTQEAAATVSGSDFNFTLASHYNDPHLKSTSSYYQWHHEVIGSSVAWAYGYTGKGIKVAVLDTGIKTGHQDISVQTIQVDSVTGVEDTYSNGHGTHVSALIGAKGNNGFGGSGVAPEAEILSIKVFGDGSTATLITAIQKSIEENADIINMSLGSALYDAPFAAKVKEAYEEGIAVFCAAGNDGNHAMFYPSAYEGAIAVGALDKSNQKAAFSNYNSAVRYVAPGVEISSANNGSTSSYRFLNGTSQASPIVAGIAAVILSAGNIQGSGADKVEHLLKVMDQGCIKVEGNGMGKGYISLVKALGLDTLTGSPSAPEISLSSGTYKEEFKELTLTPSPGTTVYYTLDGKNISIKDGVISEGAIKYIPGEIIRIEGKSKTVIKARAVSNGNGRISEQVQASYVLKPVASQMIVSSKNGENKVAAGKSLQLQAVLLPEYTADKSVKWLVEGAVPGISVTSGKVSIKKNVEPGEYLITAIAKDGSGKYQGVSHTYPIEVVREDNPITDVKFAVKTAPVRVGEETPVFVNIFYKDQREAELHQLSWKIKNEDIAVVRKEEGRLILSGLKKGKTTLIGTSKDGHGKQFLLPVTVSQQVENIEISGYTTLAAGKSITLKAQVTPANANNRNVVWSIVSGEGLIDEGISVNAKGKVKADSRIFEKYIPEGEDNQSVSCRIQAGAKDGSGVVATYTVTITREKMKSLKPSQTSVQLFRLENDYGSVTKQKILVETTGANPDAWQAESNKPGLVTVEKEGDGILVKATGKATGTATITLKSTDGSNLKKTCKVAVNNPPGQLKVAAKGGRSNYLAIGKKLKLIAVLEAPYGAIGTTSKKLEWTSSNPEAVKVDKKGNVTALTEKGTTVTITVSTTDGSNLSASFKIITCSETRNLRLEGQSGKMGYLPLGKAMAYEILYENSNAIQFNPSKQVVVTRNKEGVEPYFYTNSSTGKKKLALMANKRGTYKITIAMKDGSRGKVTYTFKVE